MEKLWAAVSHQEMVLAELLHERSAPPEEVGEQEQAFPSEGMESNLTSPAVNRSLLAELLPLIKKATAILQVPW